MKQNFATIDAALNPLDSLQQILWPGFRNSLNSIDHHHHYHNNNNSNHHFDHRKLLQSKGTVLMVSMQPAAGAMPMGPKRNPRNEGLTVGAGMDVPLFSSARQTTTSVSFDWFGIVVEFMFYQDRNRKQKTSFQVSRTNKFNGCPCRLADMRMNKEQQTGYDRPKLGSYDSSGSWIGKIESSKSNIIALPTTTPLFLMSTNISTILPQNQMVDWNGAGALPLWLDRGNTSKFLKSSLMRTTYQLKWNGISNV